MVKNTNLNDEKMMEDKYVKRIHLIPGGGKVEEYDIRECFSHRRSRRQFWPGAMTKKQLSYILWHTARIQKQEEGQVYTPVPSPGNLHPLKITIALLNILDMEKGIYEYSPKEHCLYLVERKEEMKVGLEEFFGDQKFPLEASFLYMISADVEKVKEAFPDHWEKFIYLEAGHLGQQIMLACESLHLATCPIGIVYEEKAKDYFKGQEELIYCFPIGIIP